jgi:hypothetical protein
MASGFSIGDLGESSLIIPETSFRGSSRSEFRMPQIGRAAIAQISATPQENSKHFFSLNPRQGS